MTLGLSLTASGQFEVGIGINPSTGRAVLEAKVSD